jgi:hypothetical protein
LGESVVVVIVVVVVVVFAAAWNSITITASNKLERVQRRFAALCH